MCSPECYSEGNRRKSMVETAAETATLNRGKDTAWHAAAKRGALLHHACDPASDSHAWVD